MATIAGISKAGVRRSGLAHELNPHRVKSFKISNKAA